VRTFPADAAVGLLSRDRSTLRGTLGGGGGAGALRALASEAAVGAKRPDVGREARGAAFFDAGVLGRGRGGTCGVGDLTVRGSVGGALRVPGPFGGVRGVGVLARLTRVVAAGDGRASVDGVDFGGDADVFVGLDTAAAAGRDADADDRTLVAGTGAGIEAGGGAGMSLAGIASVSAVGVVGAGDVSGMGAGCVSTCPGGALSEAGGGDGVPFVVASGAGEMAGFGGSRLPLAPVPLVLPFVLTGGHSRGMRGSSLAGSPVLLEAALVAREGGPGVAG
jgi:hypothetical protein